jgi:hypothetical protein
MRYCPRFLPAQLSEAYGLMRIRQAHESKLAHGWQVKVCIIMKVVASIEARTWMLTRDTLKASINNEASLQRFQGPGRSPRALTPPCVSLPPRSYMLPLFGRHIRERHSLFDNMTDAPSRTPIWLDCVRMRLSNS